MRWATPARPGLDGRPSTLRRKPPISAARSEARGFCADVLRAGLPKQSEGSVDQARPPSSFCDEPTVGAGKSPRIFWKNRSKRRPATLAGRCLAANWDWPYGRFSRSCGGFVGRVFHFRRFHNPQPAIRTGGLRGGSASRNWWGDWRGLIKEVQQPIKEGAESISSQWHCGD